MRVIFSEGEQKAFLEQVSKKTCWGWEEIAKACGICGRSLRDWRQEKYLMTMKAMKRLAEAADIPVPEVIEIVDEHRSAKKAGRAGGAVFKKLYGNPGTLEGRRKGGRRSQQLRRLHPERYPQVASTKRISVPKLSEPLAEFVGIVLGDGCISKYFVEVAVNKKTELEYAQYLFSLIRSLFEGASIGFVVREEQNTIGVRLYSKQAAIFLGSVGLSNNKSVPNWIHNKKDYTWACLRGLFDTEGSIGFKFYQAKDEYRVYKQLTFTNRNPSILDFVASALSRYGYKPTMNSAKNIYISNYKDINRFVREIGFRNPKLLKRVEISNYQEYIKTFGCGGLR